MTVVTKDTKRSAAGKRAPKAGDDQGRAPATDGDEVVGPGDEHVNRVESLCVGESQ